MQGYGKMIQNDGTIYEGNWVDGVMQGYGKMILPDGQEIEGNWENGSFN